MTEKDLKAEYQRETGKYVLDMSDYDTAGTDAWMLVEFLEYVSWLEQRAIELQNKFNRINKIIKEL